MAHDYDAAEHIDDADQAAEAAVAEFSEYEDFADAIDALAQSQITKSAEADNTSYAEELVADSTGDDTEREVALREANVRHEVGKALHGLLREYGHQPRQSFGADTNVSQDE